MKQEQKQRYPEYRLLGDQVVVVQFENEVSIEVNQKVRSLAENLERAEIKGITELIPTFNSLAVCYDPLTISYPKLIDKLEQLNDDLRADLEQTSRTVHIPVVYGGEYGPDVDEIARLKGLTAEEVIRLHHSTPYLVYMVGFIAGFPYCGDVDDRLVLPRRSNPRLRLPKGTIAMANKQTGIYTIPSPGGWHMIGWTPMETFNPYHNPPSLLLAGDYIKFEPITAAEAENWDEQKQREWDQRWNTLK